jgi:hypothetical protein
MRYRVGLPSRLQRGWRSRWPATWRWRRNRAASFWRCPPLVSRLDRRRRHLDLGMMMDLAESDRTQAKPSAAG